MVPGTNWHLHLLWLTMLEIAAAESINYVACVPGEIGPFFLLPDILSHLHLLIVSNARLWSLLQKGEAIVRKSVIVAGH